MEHLVEGHMGGYWIDNRDPEDITAYCEQCGDYDRILLSWQEGKMLEVLTSYFSEAKTTKEIIKRKCEAGITKSEAIENILYEYDQDKYIIEVLMNDNTISKEEGKKLIKANLQAKKNQIALACEVYPKGKTLIKKK